MPVATLYDLADRVARDLPRCPRNAMLDALRDAWHALCEEAEVYRKEVSVDLVSGQTLYRLNPHVDATITGIGEARWRTQSDIAGNRPGTTIPAYWFSVTPQGNHQYVDITDAIGIQDGGQLVLQLILQPDLYAEDEPQVPEEILNRYGAALAAKATAILAAKRGEPYFNPDLFGEQMMIYNAAKNRIRKQQAPSGGLFQ